jgi:Tfp pilus assembly protein PilO
MKESTSQPKLINRRLIMMIGFFAAVITIVVLILWPKFQELQNVQKEIENKKTEIQVKEKYLSDVNESKAQLVTYEKELVKIDSVLPGDPSIPSLFNYLQKTASESGLILEKVTSFKTVKSEKLSDFRETVVGIEIIGSYRSFKEFISVLERSARLIQVENISFSMKEEEESSLLVFNLRFKTYSH